MKILNNTTEIVKDDLIKTIIPGSRISVAAACFSIYAYQELKKELQSVEELRFIFTSPTFIAEKTQKEKREFYIPRLGREKSLYGTEFEIKLRNELKQKAIAKECATWIRNKVKFRSNVTKDSMNNFVSVENESEKFAYAPVNSFTTVDLGSERGNNISNMVIRTEHPGSGEFLELFNQVWNDNGKLRDVTEEVIESISAVYQENPAELIYFMTLYNIFSEFLDDISEEVLPNEAIGFKQSIVWGKLYNFQKDAALAIIHKLEQYNGCILADSVGLGKTFTALAVIKYYESRNKSVLVLCPKKLKDNWMTYRGQLITNPLAKDRLRYDVLYHTDLSRERGDTAIGLPIDLINWGAYDLVVIDESHNFRNGGELSGKNNEKENRYLRLLNKVIRSGVQTKVLMLSATPVNNRFYDLRNQLALAYEGYSEQINDKLNTKSDIDLIFRNAQKIYNAWSRLPIEKRTTNELLSRLDFDFFEVLDSVTIARSRKHIQRYYDTSEIGSFPERNKPISVRPKLTDKVNAINYQEVYLQIAELNLSIYTPSTYILASKLSKYIDPDSEHARTISQTGREQGIRRLMSINLLKRMESSVHSFKLTIQRIHNLYSDTLQQIEAFIPGSQITVQDVAEGKDFDLDDQNNDMFNVGKKFKIDLRDMDYLSWQRDLKADLDILELLILMIEDITTQYDYKLNELFGVVQRKIDHPINKGNRKIIIFTAFSDTAQYLYENVSKFVKEEYGINTALINGSVDGKTTLPRFPADLNSILTCFSPVSKEKALVMPNNSDEIDVLIATDCISEGQNLQDCDYVINYDIHWNPVRIIQRFGRIDRIGSKNRLIQLVNFWPDLTLDEYINLKERVEARMKISIMTSTGDDDYINQEEKGDLQYRRQQLEKLQNEVVDLEEMNSSLSILDLGLNEFRMDLLAYLRGNPDIDHTPFGIHAVVRGDKPGVIFVLKNINHGVNSESQNRLHPFYMVYMGNDGEVICNHLQPKDTLDIMRHLSREKTTPELDVCNTFNHLTKDGRDMQSVSQLLEQAISYIINVKEEVDLDSFFGKGQTTFLSGSVTGLHDFELICFMVVIS
ncbi:helicase-related protein [Paenibacillus sp. FSL H7-689]|uniref:helicase-related protein n=1 Tax=Paenibacillus sp. FSL H7-689 TaxID=1227349 RepID=UPI0003E1EF06|nr:helicase-related protein [Paenibacillus sp. FSL H7-689]ETT51579.1 helicase domain-containing protein [Paenibacillus sp. FSL H7-689]